MQYKLVKHCLTLHCLTMHLSVTSSWRLDRTSHACSGCDHIPAAVIWQRTSAPTRSVILPKASTLNKSLPDSCSTRFHTRWSQQSTEMQIAHSQDFLQKALSSARACTSTAVSILIKSSNWLARGWKATSALSEAITISRLLKLWFCLLTELCVSVVLFVLTV